MAVIRLPEGQKQIFVNWMGQELNESEKALLEELSRGDPRSREFGDHAAGVMVEIIRAVADRNELVGRGLLINSLPRWAVHPADTGTILLASAPTAEHLSFLQLPHDTNDPVLHGPRYVCEGRQMANFQAWEPTQEEIHRMTGSWEPHAPSH